MTTPVLDREAVLEAARAAGRRAAHTRHAGGLIDPAPDPHTGPLLVRQAATAWHRGFAETRDDLAKAYVPDLVKVGPEGYIHGWVCVRPPCGEKPARLRAADLTVRSDGGVIHKPSGWAVGHIARDGAAWKASHGDAHVSEHGSKGDALKAIARRHNSGKTQPTAAPLRVSEPAVKPLPAVASPPAPAPGRAPEPTRRAPAPAEHESVPPGKVTRQSPITGMALWMSGEGVTPDITDAEARAARSVWYTNTFSYTNNYLRRGTLPSVSSQNAIAELHGGYGAGHLTLPTFASNDAAYLKGIDTLKNMIGRAPKFSRPATMYRSVTSPDQIFGPVGSMKGRVFSDPGFMSATADPASAERYGKEDQGEIPDKIIMHIPAGGGGMRAQFLFSPDNAREKEFTFAPGTKWRVDEDKIVDGKRQTTVTQIVPASAKPGPVPKPIVPETRTTQSWDAGGAGHRVNVETGEYLS